MYRLKCTWPKPTCVYPRLWRDSGSHQVYRACWSCGPGNDCAMSNVSTYSANQLVLYSLLYINESIRLKPIQAYMSFISIMSLHNNDLLLVGQVSKSAGTQQTRHEMKGNHCYVKNSILPPSRRSNEIAPAQRVFWENNGVPLYNNMYIAEDKQSLHIIITSAMIIYHTKCWAIQHHIMTVILYLVGDFFKLRLKRRI